MFSPLSQSHKAAQLMVIYPIMQCSSITVLVRIVNLCVQIYLSSPELIHCLTQLNGQFRVSHWPHMHACVGQEEAGDPGDNPHRHWENNSIHRWMHISWPHRTPHIVSREQVGAFGRGPSAIGCFCGPYGGKDMQNDITSWVYWTNLETISHFEDIFEDMWFSSMCKTHSNL